METIKTEESNRMEVLACLIADLKQENNTLTERVKQLMNDYNRVAKRLQASHMLSDLTEALDKNEELEREKESLCKQLKSLQESHDLLNGLYDSAKANLQKTKEKCKAAEVNYNDLRQNHDDANFRIERFEQSEFVEIGQTCPYIPPECLGEVVKVGSEDCFACDHFLKADLAFKRCVLCACRQDCKE